MQNNQFYSENVLTREEITGPWVEVDLDCIAHNFRQIKALVGDRPLMPVIKANAYGHGLAAVGLFLEKTGAAGLCVGKLEEALMLRQAGVCCPILNFGPYSRKEAEYVVAHDITQSVFNEAVAHLEAAAARLGKKAMVHLKIDTGLGRVGVPHAEALEYIGNLARLSHVQIKGVFTSLSEDGSLDAMQLERFHSVHRAATAMGISLGIRHIASSAGLLVYPEAHLDMVRPGISTFGYYPSTEEFRQRKIDLRPALSLKTRVSNVRRLRPGDSVGYHQAYVAATEHLLVTGAIGYPDGFPPQLVQGGEVLIQGRRHPLVMGATANHIYVKAGLDEPIALGDEIVVIGQQQDERISCEDLVKLSGLSEYKLLACINPLMPRYYHESKDLEGSL
ncbi:MAG TPA: alanine racemase [Holophaga sp.]|nr:alanine racemase [Holophaga sp.]HPS66657.1 alanine racemase [Holophaga sp.]